MRGMLCELCGMCVCGMCVGTQPYVRLAISQRMVEPQYLE